MNKLNRFKAAVIAGLISLFGFTGTVNAVNVNPDGLGQVLLYPYYTVNGGNFTLVSLTNTTDQAKAVKVRFLEGQNSREVLDFNLYMSAHDMWVAAISMVDGVPVLTVPDTSCTTPYLYMNDMNGDGVRDGMQEFLPYAFEIDGGSADMVRATEGHFEVIEMGVVVDDVKDTATAVTHTNGFPNDCAQLQEAWTDYPSDSDDGYWITDPSVDMLPPTGGLFGAASVVNVEHGALYSFSATAINGWADSLQGNHFLHQVPGTILPSLNSGNITEGVVFTDDGQVLKSQQFARGVDAISYVLMHDQIMNEYNINDVMGASTEWVVTFPTKNFYVDTARNGGSTTPVAPFTSNWYATSADMTPACEVVMLDSVWDREEATVVTPEGDVRLPTVSPSLSVQPDPIVPFELCYETTVIRFGSASDELEQSEVLGSYNFTTVDVDNLGFKEGWMRLQLSSYPHDADENGVIDSTEQALTREPLSNLMGLPVIGFKVERYINGYVEGNKVANYGATVTHKATRKATQVQ